MTRLCLEHGGINLAQGFPDFHAPQELKDAAKQAIGVAAVPGSSFFRNSELGEHLVRLAFCKKLETLEAAANRIQQARPLATRRGGNVSEAPGGPHAGR